MNRYISLLALVVLIFACDGQTGINGDYGEDNTIHISGIYLDPSSITLKEGDSASLSIEISPSNASNKAVVWSSSNEGVASVDDGKVTGVQPGSATITATTEDGGKKATCSVTVESNLAPSVTVSAEFVSAVSAVLKGKANLGASLAADLSVGFQYSTSAGILPSNSITVEATDADANYNYTMGITGLEPNTKYYFRSYVRQKGQDTYGETKDFTTKDVASMLETKDATGIQATKATMNAKLDLTDVQYGNLTYGFLLGSSEADLNTDFKCTEIKDNAISATLSNLSHKTQYWYKAYVKLDSQTFNGEVKAFTTDVVKVESVSLDRGEYTFNTIENTLTLNATVLPSDATDKSVVWSSSNESVITVDQNGTLKAVGNGTASITVTPKDQGKTATCAITVAQWVTSISLDAPSVTLDEGQEQTLTAIVLPGNAADKTLKWTSSDESIATVDQTGRVMAISKGTATIKAEANDGSGKIASCLVTVNRLVSSIELDKTSIIVYNGKTETLFATVTPSSANNKSVTWASSNPSVATVSASGLVEGIARGTTNITVTANDGSGISAICDVEVRQYVTSITLSHASLSLLVGSEGTISVTSVLPDNANDKSYTWSSSNISIATVDNSGKVTARAKGKATIQVSALDGGGVSALCSVVVSTPCPAGAVDLGTTSSDGYNLYWATCNLCEDGFVSSPEQYGDYYAWGELEPHYVKGHSQDSPCTKWRVIDGKTMTGYNWASYKWCNGSSSTLMKKYNTDASVGTVDSKTEFSDYDYADDVARHKLGGKWRMPTAAEWTELIEQCTLNWTGNGYNVIGKNGNSIFLPAAGYRDDSSRSGGGSNPIGYYWSSSLATNDTRRARLVNVNCYCASSVGIIYRYYGCSVRPVSE